MDTNFTSPSEKAPEPPRPRRTMRPNSLRNAQVLPPHHVDLTLSPSTYDDIHVPAHISGVDLLKGGLSDTRGAAAKKDMRRL